MIKDEGRFLAFQENELGWRIYLDLRDPRARALAKASGDLNPGSLKLFQLAARLCKWDIVVDVGANYGEMLAGLEGLGGLERVLAFEPNRRLVPLLRRTFADVAGAVQVRGVALGRRNSVGLFLENKKWSGTSLMISSARDLVNYFLRRRWAGFALRLVRQRTLDNQLGAISGKTILVKIDVEGLEIEVLGGARRVIAEASDYGLVVEILHLRYEQVSHLFDLGHVYMLDLGTEGLVEIRDVEALRAIREEKNSTLYRQDIFISSFKSSQF
jgi:FkbM family methyltransferase